MGWSPSSLEKPKLYFGDMHREAILAQTLDIFH